MNNKFYIKESLLDTIIRLIMASKMEKRILDMFNNNKFDDDFINVQLDPIVNQLILPYQILHVMNLVAALKKGKDVTIIDGSSTGTGKTYSAAATCAQLGLRPYIICPRSIIGNWKNICGQFNVNPIEIVNYETIRHCKEYNLMGKRVGSKYLRKEGKTFKWDFSSLGNDAKNVIVIFDEAHKCKNNNSLNGKILLGLKKIARVILLSATLCDKPKDFLVFGYMLGFYDDLKKGRNWIQGIIREDANKFGKESTLSKKIFPLKGSKMSLEDLGTKIPQNIISTECYTIKQKYAKKINEEYEKIRGNVENDKGNKGILQLKAITKARQKIEKYKVPIMIELTNKYMEDNKSVVIFINFLKTMNMLKSDYDKLGIKYSIIVGGQTDKDRLVNIELFQKNENRVIVVMMQAGGESINLHDTNGKFPRVSIISPSMSSIELIQALGRIYRAEVKSRVLQKLIYCDNTYETNICNIIKKKVNFINKLTDDDLIKF